MEKDEAIYMAGRIWERTIADIPELKRRIRDEAEAEIQREVERRQRAAAKAIHRARKAGATKTALRNVTTKDHYDFEFYVALGERLAARREARRAARTGQTKRS